MIEELKQLPASDRETIIQSLHWAIAEKLEKTIIPLNYFREGEHVQIGKFDYSELYNAFRP